MADNAPPLTGERKSLLGGLIKQQYGYAPTEVDRYYKLFQKDPQLSMFYDKLRNINLYLEEIPVERQPKDLLQQRDYYMSILKNYGQKMDSRQ